MQTRETKVILNKSGGVRGGSIMTRVTIPAEWSREMGIDENNREIKVSFDGEKMIVQPNKEVFEMRDKIIKDIQEDNTLVLLEETGKINIDQIDDDLELFIEALEIVTGKEYHISNEVGGQYIREYK